MAKSVCQGSLKFVSTKQMDNGFSRAHLKSMFGLSKYPDNGLSITGTSESFEDLAIDYTDGVSISGVQRKLFMTLENGVLKPVVENGLYIVKPSPQKFPELAENEHAIMCLARAVGLDVADCSLIPFENGERAYVTKRFDITASGQRLFIEDGASLCNIHPKHKGDDSLSYENTLKELYQASGNQKTVLLNAFNQVLFSFIVGNSDLHLKNFSMYREPTSNTTTMNNFTPIYDVLSIAPYPAYDGEYMTLSLLHSELDSNFSSSYESYGYYTFHDFLLLAENIGLGEKAGASFIKKLASKVEQTADVVMQNSFCSANLREIILKRIKERCSCLKRPVIS
ncbi:HipA domain-containing protein [Thalassotalea sp. ND16A]|uniref:HipA domain-containing protein n=1 Tax=Thalassotalea sp. ND16A TaxID=1535422 RepID=UPI000519F8FB|nr:HipA domain-containing protein [Thalassotalea sp. ND16A]KGK00539.1 hypothetical protein ND16A_3299 [Thalassotalea sp. ND16A]